MTDPIKPGDVLTVIDASGERLTRRAVSGVLEGHRFPVVRVCREETWQQAQAEGRVPDFPHYVPWPFKDIVGYEKRYA